MQKALARGIAASCALVALAAAGPALGGDPVSTSFSATFELGGTISFVLDEQNNRKVHDIVITDMSADCEGRAGELDFKIYGDTKVLADRSFEVFSEDSSGKGKAMVRGRFSRGFRRAKGKARIYGRFLLQDGWSRCESGKQRFVARVID